MSSPVEQNVPAVADDDLHALNPLNDYYFRLLLALAAVGTLLLNSSWQTFTQQHFLAIVWLAYPHGVYLLATRYLEKQLENVIHYAGYCDAFLVGLMIGVTNFDLLPAFMFFTVIQSQSLMNNGVRYWLQTVGAVAIGFLVSLLFHKQLWHWQGNVSTGLPAMIGVSIYFGLLSFFMYRRTKDLTARVDKATDEHQAMRMKLWKLSRYVSPQIWRSVYSGSEVKLETNRKRLTVFFSDIKGFTELSESLEADQMTDMLNHYLSEMSQIIHKYGGTIDKFIGDAIMVFLVIQPRAARRLIVWLVFRWQSRCESICGSCKNIGGARVLKRLWKSAWASIPATAQWVISALSSAWITPYSVRR